MTKTFPCDPWTAADTLAWITFGNTNIVWNEERFEASRVAQSMLMKALRMGQVSAWAVPVSEPDHTIPIELSTYFFRQFGDLLEITHHSEIKAACVPSDYDGPTYKFAFFDSKEVKSVFVLVQGYFVEWLQQRAKKYLDEHGRKAISGDLIDELIAHFGKQGICVSNKQAQDALKLVSMDVRRARGERHHKRFDNG